MLATPSGGLREARLTCAQLATQARTPAPPKHNKAFNEKASLRAVGEWLRHSIRPPCSRTLLIKSGVMCLSTLCAASNNGRILV